MLACVLGAITAIAAFVWCKKSEIYKIITKKQFCKNLYLFSGFCEFREDVGPPCLFLFAFFATQLLLPSQWYLLIMSFMVDYSKVTSVTIARSFCVAIVSHLTVFKNSVIYIRGVYLDKMGGAVWQKYGWAFKMEFVRFVFVSSYFIDKLVRNATIYSNDYK